MKILTLAIITMALTAQAQTVKEIKLKNIRAEGRSARYSFNLYKDKVAKSEVKINNKKKDIEAKEEDLLSSYKRAKCRSKEGCKHNRDLSCYKLKRTLDKKLSVVKKERSLLEKYEKEYETNKKFMDKNKAYMQELIQMLKE